QRQAIHRIFDALANDVQLALEPGLPSPQSPVPSRQSPVRIDWRLETGDWRQGTGDWRLETGGDCLADENLFDDRPGGHGRGSEQTVVGRHGPPAEYAMAFIADDLLDERADLVPLG